MSQGMNKVILVGRLGADPELRFTQKGSVLNMRLATNESWVDKNKQVQERTEWHRVAVFGPRAEGLAKVLAKGACICVEGRLNTSSYEKEGVTHYSTEIIAREIYLTGRRAAAMPPSDEDTLVGSTAAPAQNGGKNGSPKLQAELSEDLPF